MENKTISSNISIDLSSRPQIDAYHKLLLAIGGHAQEQASVVTASPLTQAESNAPLFKDTTEEPKVETPKRSRSKKTEEPKVETPTKEEPKTEEPNEEAAEAPNDGPAINEEGISVDEFRALIAEMAMHPDGGMAKREEFKVWAKDAFGTFKADELTQEQLNEAAAWVRAKMK